MDYSWKWVIIRWFMDYQWDSMDYQWISHEFPERFPKWWISHRGKYTKSSTQQIKDDLNLRYTEIKSHWCKKSEINKSTSFWNSRNMIARSHSFQYRNLNKTTCLSIHYNSHVVFEGEAPFRQRKNEHPKIYNVHPGSKIGEDASKFKMKRQQPSAEMVIYALRCLSSSLQTKKFPQ